MTPQELKSSILQHAITGKLVPQSNNAKPIGDVIAEKQSSSATKKAKSKIDISTVDKPFDIPDTWGWITLGDLCNIVNGFTPLRTNPAFWENPTVAWFTVEDIHLQGRRIKETRQAINRCALSANTDRIVPAGTVLLCCTASVGEYAYAEIPLTTNQQFNGLVIKEEYADLVDSEFLFSIAPTFKDRLLSVAGKTTFNFISVKKLSEMLIPVPPLEEQKRIVAKLEETIPIIDRYEAAWNKLEEFNKRFPGDMQKSILQLAIQGKLVEQCPEEGTGEELFQQIQAEKQALIKAGRTKKEKPLPEIAEEEIPFDIPSNWKWVRLIDLCKSISDGDHQPPPQVPQGIPFLVISNVSGGSIDFSNTRYVPQDYFDALSDDRVAQKGDILFTVTGSYGIPIKVDCEQQFCFQRHIALLKLLVDWDYLYCALISPVIKAQCDAVATGTAQKTVGLKPLRSMLVPLPPLPEQKRIVAKLEEILPLCDRLK